MGYLEMDARPPETVETTPRFYEDFHNTLLKLLTLSA